MQKYLQPIILAAIALFTYIVYRGSLENQFTNWDDLGYVITNPLIKDSSSEGFWRLFHLDSNVMGNYHPLTIVTYWLEYGAHGLEPYFYHRDSLIYHIIATITAFLFVKTLTRNTVAAGVTALLFAIHPMRTESVTWVAGRKDILYSIFYLLACTTHIYYIRAEEKGKKAIWVLSTIVLFAASLLCKSVAVTLPVVLLFVDYYERRKLNYMLLVEKIPLFALSVGYGLVSIEAQKHVGALGTLDVKFSVIERAALGCYGLITYLWKMVLPVGMTNFYPYPIKEHDALPAGYYAYLILALGMLFAVVRWGLKNRLLILGVAFFLLNLVLLLQFFPVGGAVMSDRYTYLPYLGLFLVLGWYIGKLSDEHKPMAKGLLAAVVGMSLVYGYMTNERNKDWYNSITLWNAAIEKNPESPIGYFYLGQDYYTRFENSVMPDERKKNGDSAYYYFSKSVEHKPDYTSPIVCIGEYLRSTGRIDEAKVQYQKALAIKDDLESAYLGLGVVYSIKQQYDSAGPAFRKALSLKEFFPEGYSNYANFLDITGKTDSALLMYDKSLGQNPDAYIPYMNRARIYIRSAKPELAIRDYEHAAMLQPDNPDPLLMQAKVYAEMGKKGEARKKADEAKAKGARVDDAFYRSLL